jgi:hypothetical protein
MRAGLYRRYAQECLHFASEMTLPESRAVLLDMAHNWLALANAADKHERAYSDNAAANSPRPEIIG